MCIAEKNKTTLFKAGQRRDSPQSHTHKKIKKGKKVCGWN